MKHWAAWQKKACSLLYHTFLAQPCVPCRLASLASHCTVFRRIIYTGKKKLNAVPSTNC